MPEDLAGDLLVLSRAKRNAIESLHWGMVHFGSLTTNRVVQKRTVDGLVKDGIAKSVGQVVLCDDDGGIFDPERIREGFVLTDYGVKIHAALIQWYEMHDCSDAGKITGPSEG